MHIHAQIGTVSSTALRSNMHVKYRIQYEVQVRFSLCDILMTPSILTARASERLRESLRAQNSSWPTLSSLFSGLHLFSAVRPASTYSARDPIVTHSLSVGNEHVKPHQCLLLTLS